MYVMYQVVHVNIGRGEGIGVFFALGVRWKQWTYCENEKSMGRENGRATGAANGTRQSPPKTPTPDPRRRFGKGGCDVLSCPLMWCRVMV